MVVYYIEESKSVKKEGIRLTKTPQLKVMLPENFWESKTDSMSA